MRWTTDMINQFVFLKEQGLTLDEIAAEIGCTFDAARAKNKKLIDQGMISKAPRGGRRKKKEDNTMDKKEIEAAVKTAEECNETVFAKAVNPEAKPEKSETKADVEEVGGFINEKTEPIVPAAPAETTVKHSYSSKAVDLINQCLKLADAAEITISSLHISVSDIDLELFGGKNPSTGSVIGTNADGYTIKIECHI